MPTNFKERETSVLGPDGNPTNQGTTTNQPTVSNSLNDNTTSSPPNSNIITGCTKRGAINYNPNATIDDGSCVYDDSDYIKTYTNESRKISFIISSKPTNARIFVDNKQWDQAGGITTPGVVTFTVEELLSPKIIKLQKVNYESAIYYRIKTVIKQKALYDLDLPDDVDLRKNDDGSSSSYSLKNVIRYHLLVLEKYDGSKWTEQKIPNYNPNINSSNLDTDTIENITSNLELPSSVNLGFILFENDLDNPVGISNNLSEAGSGKSYNIFVNLPNDLPNDVTLQYELDGGGTGYIYNRINPIEWNSNLDTKLKLSFIGVDELQYTTQFAIPTNVWGETAKIINGIDYEVDLKSNNQSIGAIIKIKDNDVKVPKIKLLLGKDSSPLTYSNFFNINDLDSVFEIPYSTEFADSIKFTIGNVSREYPANGSIILSPVDFSNGIGNYIVNLQPYSSKFGYGASRKLTIFVQSKKILPGPDIRNIAYPTVIKGADFKGYDVEFTMNWNAVNTNWVEIYVTKRSDKTLIGKFTPTSIGSNTLSKNTKKDSNKKTNTKINLKVSDILKKSEIGLNLYRDITQFDLILIPFNTEGDVKVSGKEEKITITFDKGDVLRRDRVIGLLRDSITSQLDTGILEKATSKYLTHLAHFGNGDNKLIATWATDTETFSEFTRDSSGNFVKSLEVPSLVLKMYEPLPKSVTPNQLIWISKIQSLSNIEEVEIIDQEVSYCTPLQPNFSAELTDDLGYSLYDTILSEDVTTSNKLINTFVSQSGFTLNELNLDYVKDLNIVSNDGALIKVGEEYYWKNFVKYSSAKERLDNFVYKIKMLEAYESKKSELVVDTPSVQIELNRIDSNINKLKSHFDGFEHFLYTTSGSVLSYPGAGESELSSSDSTVVNSWYVTASLSADLYDKNNVNILTTNLPKHILNRENQDFILFFNMIGHHFDNLWAYTKKLSDVKRVENKYKDGIFDKIIPNMLNSLGWDVDLHQDSQTLWEYAFGYLDSSGTNQSELSGKDRKSEILRRILNNLPYLYKYKGTRRALHAAMACYGVPASALTILEYGGPSEPDNTFSTFTFSEPASSIRFTGNDSVKVPWKEYSNTSDHPNTVEIRFNSENSGNYTLLQTNNTWKLELLPSSGSNLTGKAVFSIDSNGNTVSMSTQYLPIFNDNYYNISITKNIAGGSEIYTLYIKESFQERIRNFDTVSMSLDVGSTSWKSGSYLEIGSGSLGNFTGNVDEFRLWSTVLNESNIENHTLIPDAIDGNHVSASTEDLIFRLDFEYPKNRASDTAIKNVSINTDYGESFATASSFESITEYPYQYETYDRDVTARIPSTGISFANKVRLEEQSLLTNLSYKSRATKKSFDRSPIDSDRLGIFLSPIKEINMDIIKSLGVFNIDNYIGNPSDQYNDGYKELDDLRNYYFKRYNLNLYEYIQLVRYIDKSLFKVLESLSPARAKVATGLLIEPHILQRSRVALKKPTTEKRDYETNTIDFENEINLSIDYDNFVANFDNTSSIEIDTSYTDVFADIADDVSISLESEVGGFDVNIYENTISSIDVGILKNKNSDTAAINIEIDADILQEAVGQYYNESVVIGGGFGYEDTAVGGFRFWGLDGLDHTAAIITEIDPIGQITKRRMRVYRLKQKYSVETPTSSGSVVEELYNYKLTLLPIEDPLLYTLELVDDDTDLELVILEISGNYYYFTYNTFDVDTGDINLNYAGDGLIRLLPNYSGDSNGIFGMVDTTGQNPASPTDLNDVNSGIPCYYGIWDTVGSGISSPQNVSWNSIGYIGFDNTLKSTFAIANPNISDASMNTLIGNNVVANDDYLIIYIDSNNYAAYPVIEVVTISSDSVVKLGTPIYQSGQFNFSALHLARPEFIGFTKELVGSEVVYSNDFIATEIDIQNKILRLRQALNFNGNYVGGIGGLNLPPEIKNEVVAVESLDGGFAGYAYNHELPTGLKRSFDEGSKVTNKNTIDGGPAVQTFTTNPNTLKVNESGRGSGEPILIVD